MGKFKKMWEVSNHSLYNADEGEPDTGFIRGDEQRTLGALAGKPEPWFERGGYKQLDFPKADYIYGKGEEEDFAVRKTAYIAQIDKDFEAHFEKWEEWIPDEDFETQNTEKLNDSKYIKAVNNLLLERVDFLDTAKNLIRQYGLKSKVKIGRGKDFGEYVPETDTVTIRPSYPNIKEFLMTVLHVPYDISGQY